MLQRRDEFVPIGDYIRFFIYYVEDREEMLTYKFRIYPTAAQSRIMEETLETCRRVYNSMLADRIGSRG